MPSPFPGMDPYLESHWRDVHHRLITYAADAVQEALPAQLRARVEERVVLEGLDEHPLNPDLRVIESRPLRTAPALPRVAGPATTPILVEATSEPLTEGFIEIVDLIGGHRVVTIVEFLSPTNKIPGDGRQEYIRKQQGIVRSDTNLVEIDLLRTGRHTVAVPRANIPATRRSPYIVCVRRAIDPARAEVYPILLSEKLPTIAIPLRPDDADVALDLQALMDQCYRNGRYESDLDYRLDPDPPLIGPDADWATALLQGLGLRRPSRTKKRRTPPRP